MGTIFLAWQDPRSRRLFPVGRLTTMPTGYRFAYVRGVQDASRQGFEPLPSFKDVSEVYEAEQLFPLFANRLLSATRPDYQAFLGWLGVDVTPHPDPVELLARSGGQRLTDQLEIFPMPEKTAPNVYESHFFVHGLRHMPEESAIRASKLSSGDRLCVLHDFQNDKDRQALVLRSPESFDGDMHLLGYCPRYLFADTFDSMVRNEDWPRITIEQVNPPPAPVRFRIFCRVEIRLEGGIEPFSSDQFQPFSTKLAA